MRRERKKWQVLVWVKGSDRPWQIFHTCVLVGTSIRKAMGIFPDWYRIESKEVKEG